MAAPIEEYGALCREAGAELIVDEAHAVGVLWGAGRGLAGEVFVSVNTAGQGDGGLPELLWRGSSEAVEYLIQRARTFIFFDGASTGYLPRRWRLVSR